MTQGQFAFNAIEDSKVRANTPRAASGPSTYRDTVAACFRAKPNTWIDGLTLAEHGGAYAWRTRVAECRSQLAMTIENRQRRAPGTKRSISEYRWVP